MEPRTSETGPTGVDEAVAGAKLEDLDRILRDLPAAVVAFSGGTDSAFLAYTAHRILGERALAVTANSPSLARSELEDATGFARRFGIRHRIAETDELHDEDYTRNGPSRCFHCKDALMDVLEPIARELKSAAILCAVNVDDLGDFRPGQQAVVSRGGRFPLVEVGLSKAEIRFLSRELGLPTWNKPAAACLSSRIAYGIPVTREALVRIETAEEALRALGLGGRVRVRDQGGELARIEVEPEDFAVVVSRRSEILLALRGAGFRFVTLDLDGYRMGSHNLALVPLSSVRGPGT